MRGHNNYNQYSNDDFYDALFDPRFSNSINRILNLSHSDAKEIQRHLERLVNRLEMKVEDLDKQTTSERIKLTERLSSFDWEHSKAWEVIKEKGWDQLNHKELLSIASIIGTKCNVSLDREAKRRKPILVKWFDENLDKIKDSLDYIRLEFDNQQEEN